MTTRTPRTPRQPPGDQPRTTGRPARGEPEDVLRPPPDPQLGPQDRHLAKHHPAVTSGEARLFVLPAFPAIVPAAGILTPYGIAIGAQDIAAEDTGPYTGEVGGPVLKESGCRYAEVGHAERRRLYGEGDTVVAAKTAAALRNVPHPGPVRRRTRPGRPPRGRRAHPGRGRAPAARPGRSRRPGLRTPVGHPAATGRRRPHREARGGEVPTWVGPAVIGIVVLLVWAIYERHRRSKSGK
ncbi:hypothetical protein GCM10014715_78540 [Streptomyces spiralis]|uniref:Triosephosphate isomerase n=1 Tax=Streptomyces spiralis TaxID=66376 RepID=A0A919E3W3_9ACTN|nr:hypothetical protein GCM10014715_78540 [Streptomyces spiralis]